MTFGLAGVIQVSLIVGLALGAARLLRRRSAAVRHWVLTVAVVCAGAAPALGVIAPSWSLPSGLLQPSSAPPPRIAVGSVGPTAPAAVRATVLEVDAAPAGSSVALPALTARHALQVLWLSGTFVSLAMLGVGIGRLRRLATSARPIRSGRWAEIAREVSSGLRMRRHPILFLGGDRAMLVTWGVLRPKVLLPPLAEEWSEERVRAVLRHELAHAQRRDWLAQMAAAILRSLYWFNPLVWIICRRLRDESEYACDDAVLRDGLDGRDYAMHLVEVARVLNAGRSHWIPAPAMARASSLEGRITAMLNPRTNRRPIARSARLLVVAIALVVAAAIVGAQTSFFSLSGFVKDSTNRALEGTVLVLTNQSSHARYEVRSDVTGHFEFVGLPNSEYSLEATRQGFVASPEGVTIAGRSLQREITLQVGSLNETIRVSDDSSKTAAAASQETIDAGRQRAETIVTRVMDNCRGNPITTGGNIVPPRKVYDVRPIYPEYLKTGGSGGIVTMDALIGTDGNVQDVHVVDSPHPDLDRAASDAVRQWQFSPTFLNCTPIEVHMRVTTTFVSGP